MIAQPSTPAPRGIVAQVAAPVRRYLATEAGSAGLLLAATVLALVWANVPAGYAAFWRTPIAIRVGDAELALDARHWVNDGLMTLFFLVVGLEVVRELAMGELTDRRRLAVPVVAALAAMAVPALVFLTVVPAGPAAHAWGVVVSSDTAFVLGALALIAPRGEAPLRVFLLTLAVADDIGALLVIGVFYTGHVAVEPLVLAAACLGLMAAVRLLPRWRGQAYLILGVGVWLAVEASGIPPTIAGVAMALIPPVYEVRRADVDEAARLARNFRQSPNADFAVAARRGIDASVSDNERLQRLYHPWASYVVVPLFALANAGVPLGADAIADAARSPVTLAVVAALVLGKPVGVLVGTWAAVVLRLGPQVPGLRAGTLAGGAALSGIGFTIALFIVDLALPDPALADQARIGILTGSALAAGLGWAVFGLVERFGWGPTARPDRLDPPVDPDRDHVRGPVDAELTLVEYGDFECPFCGRATGVVQELRDRFGDRLRYVFRHTPLADVHPRAELAAEAAEAAGAQGRFWEMHDRLFAHQDRLDAASLLEHAAAVDLDLPRFARDLGSGRYGQRVRDDAASAEASGVSGTPTFFVGGRRHTGPTDAGTLTEALLAAALTADPPGGAGPPSEQADIAPVPPVPAPALPSDLAETADDGVYPRLSAPQLARVARQGTARAITRGEVLFLGDEVRALVVVRSGAVAVVRDPGRPDQGVLGVHGAGRFLLGPQRLGRDPARFAAVVVRPGEIVVVAGERLPRLLDGDPELADVLARSYLLRRAHLDTETGSR